MRRSRLCRCLALLIGCCLSTSSPASAAQFAVLSSHGIGISEEAFEKKTFQQLSMLAARKRCDDSLQALLSLIEHPASLSEAQQGKLELAGRADIHRFFASYDALKRTISFGSVVPRGQEAELARINESLSRYQSRYDQGLHGTDSLFAKTLSTALRPEQRKVVSAVVQQRARNIYAGYVATTLAVMDQTIPLTQVQRRKLTELLLSQPNPPTSFGTSAAPVYRVVGQMSQLTEQLRDLFTAQQWETVQDWMQSSQEVEP